MKEYLQRPKLIYEEKKAIKLFLWLFYIFYISFEVAYYYLFPLYERGTAVTIKTMDGLGFWNYLIIFSLLPLSIYLNKKGNIYIIKYLYIY
ncbi:two-component sensor histidine kinase, partial [Neobacillus niacini]